MVKWAITKYQHSWVGTRLRVLVWTDQPIHAFLHYSLSPELFAYITSERRGIRRLVKPLWELANPIILEQNVRGDTDCHAFYIFPIPNKATLTFFITATQNGIEAKSVSIPIRIQHPLQNGADPVDPQDFVDCGAFDPWTQNQIDFATADFGIWDDSDCTLTASLSQLSSGLRLRNGADPASIGYAKIFGHAHLRLDPDLPSQLRVITNITDVDDFTIAGWHHGIMDSGNSAYGFVVSGPSFYGQQRSTVNPAMVYLCPCVEDRWYLLEAKFFPGKPTQFWVDGDYIASLTENPPNSKSHCARMSFYNPNLPNTYITTRRFMVWQQSIWTS